MRRGGGRESERLGRGVSGKESECVGVRGRGMGRKNEGVH
jgi:hypothetical protein